MKWILIALVKAYRATISPMLGDVCKYYPSCSAYGLEALHTHGALKGTLLITARIARCNPFSHGGVNPVPPRGQWRASVNPDGTTRLHSHLNEVSA